MLQDVQSYCSVAMGKALIYWMEEIQLKIQRPVYMEDPNYEILQMHFCKPVGCGSLWFWLERNDVGI